MNEDTGRILIVEDETIVALDIKKKLVKLGYNVTDIVSSGEEAIEKVGKISPDLILMDIALEGNIDGIEAARRIRSHSDIPIIYLTAHSDKKTLDRAKVTEPLGYIVKPFERENLHATVEMAIYKHRARRKLEEKEEERNRLLAYLEQARKKEALGTLAGGIAHDFNNILSIILGFTELSLSELSEGNPIRANLKRVINACLRARDVVRQILIFSHPGEKQIKPVKVGPLVEESLKFFRSSIPSNIEVRLNIDAETDVVLGDAAEINQVLIHLCSNAVYAMKDKGGTLDVDVEDVKINNNGPTYLHELNPGHYVRLTVADTGHGMEPAVLERIFDPYFTTRDVGEGTGMGLAVVHGIVKKHEGAVAVESEPGNGTTFQVYFPISEQEIVSDIDIKTTGLIPRGKEHVLFVDDEEEVVVMVKRMLEYLGYHVEAKISGHEALEIFQSRPQQFDLAILDLIMPRISGTALAKEILKIRPGISIIICTGFREKLDKEEMKAMGIDAVISKPIVMHEIARSIRDVLDKET